MNVFREVLRGRVDDAQEGIVAAMRDGHDDKVSVNRAQLQDFLALAATHSIDTGDRLDHAVGNPVGSPE